MDLKNFFYIFILFFASSCVGDNKLEKNPAPCPFAFAVKDASNIISFEAGAQKIDNVIFSGEIINVNSVCRYLEGTPIKSNLEIDFSIGIGPASIDKEVEFSYFVSVVKPNAHVISKKTFTKKLKFEEGEQVRNFREVFDDITIPRANNQISGSNYQILVGFQLNRSQIIFNRSGKSLKFPDM